MTTLDPKTAFLHVIDAHRWLAASGCAWNIAGANAPKETKDQIHQLLPNIDVMIRDCLLVHARSLINFYNSDGRKTDIFLRHFGITLDPTLAIALARYKNPIGVHLFHLTAWRDPSYRSSSSTLFRPDWNADAIPIVELILDALKYVSQQSTRWELPFQELYKALIARFQDKSSPWPQNLCGEANVSTYLTKLGL